MNRVTLNLPAGPNLEPPIPGKPPLLIDGKPILYLVGVAVQAGDASTADPQRRTLVTLAFYAEVDGEIMLGEDGDALLEVKVLPEGVDAKV